MKKSDIFAYIRKKSQILSSLLKFSLKEILVIGIIFFLLYFQNLITYNNNKGEDKNGDKSKRKTCRRIAFFM